MLRGLIGGAGAVTVAAVFEQDAGAQCDPNADTITCPPGSFHAGQIKKPAGECCNGNGNCCSNTCTDGFCVDGPVCVVEGGNCSEGQCCDGLECFEGICYPQECQTEGEICEVAENCCEGLHCHEGYCACFGVEQSCDVPSDCCPGLVCIEGYCAESDDCAGLGEICLDSAECCGDLVCVDYFCGYELPNTGVGDGSSGSSGLLNAAVAGSAAALIAAKVLRRKSASDASNEG